MDSPVISVEGVGQRFRIGRSRTIRDRLTGGNRFTREFWALRDVSFALEPGRSLALLGPNGSGKSSLLKVIAGILAPTEGLVRRRGRLTALLELGAGFHPDLTGRENVYLNASILGMGRAETDQLFDAIVEFSGVEQFIDTPVRTYSSGMYVRLGFAVAAQMEPDLLLVDEVLAVGDEAFQDRCLARVRDLQDEGRSIVLVTHSMDSAIAFTDQALLLDHGRIVEEGETVAVADAYHRLMRGGEREYAADSGAWSGPAGVRSVRVLAGEVLSPALIRTGEDLDVEVVVGCTEPVAAWCVKLQVWTTDGQFLFGTSTDRRAERLPPLQGDTTLVFRLPALPLSGGAYRILVEVNDTEQSLAWHRVSDAHSFRIPEDRRYAGPVQVSATIEVR